MNKAASKFLITVVVISLLSFTACSNSDDKESTATTTTTKLSVAEENKKILEAVPKAEDIEPGLIETKRALVTQEDVEAREYCKGVERASTVIPPISVARVQLSDEDASTFNESESQSTNNSRTVNILITALKDASDSKKFIDHARNVLETCFPIKTTPEGPSAEIDIEKDSKVKNIDDGFDYKIDNFLRGKKYSTSYVAMVSTDHYIMEVFTDSPDLTDEIAEIIVKRL